MFHNKDQFKAHGASPLQYAQPPKVPPSPEEYYKERFVPPSPEEFYEKQAIPPSPEKYYEKQAIPPSPEKYYEKRIHDLGQEPQTVQHGDQHRNRNLGFMMQTPKVPLSPKEYYEKRVVPPSPEEFYENRFVPPSPEEFYEKRAIPPSPEKYYEKRMHDLGQGDIGPRHSDFDQHRIKNLDFMMDTQKVPPSPQEYYEKRVVPPSPEEFYEKRNIPPSPEKFYEKRVIPPSPEKYYEKRIHDLEQEPQTVPPRHSDADQHRDQRIGFMMQQPGQEENMGSKGYKMQPSLPRDHFETSHVKDREIFPTQDFAPKAGFKMH